MSVKGFANNINRGILLGENVSNGANGSYNFLWDGAGSGSNGSGILAIGYEEAVSGGNSTFALGSTACYGSAIFWAIGC